MAVTISDNYQVKYTRKWGTLLQQHASRLDKYVSVMRDLSGKVVFLDQFGVLDFTEKTTRVGQTVLNEAPTTRRSMLHQGHRLRRIRRYPPGRHGPSRQQDD